MGSGDADDVEVRPARHGIKGTDRGGGGATRHLVPALFDDGCNSGRHGREFVTTATVRRGGDSTTLP